MPDEIVIVKDGILNEELENILKKYESNYKSLIKIYGINEHVGLGKALAYGVKKCNYDETIIEDYDLWARMILKNAQMANMPVVLSKNRTGIRMYKKRSSKNYIKGIKEIENKLYKYGLINRMECMVNKIVRITIAKAPIKLKFKIYSFMRKIS